MRLRTVEKTSFHGSTKIIDAGTMKLARFQSTVTPHLSWILPVQLPLIHMNACCSLWKIRRNRHIDDDIMVEVPVSLEKMVPNR